MILLLIVSDFHGLNVCWDGYEGFKDPGRRGPQHNPKNQIFGSKTDIHQTKFGDFTTR